MPDGFIIRATTRADVPALDAMFARAYPVLLEPDYPASVLAVALPIIARANPDLVASGSYYVAVDSCGGAFLGAGGWTAESPHQPEPPGTGHIRHVATDPFATRHGVASAIVTHAMGAATQAGLIRLVAMSTRTAVPFYEAMGFTAEREESVQLRPGIGFAAVRMSRDL